MNQWYLDFQMKKIKMMLSFDYPDNWKQFGSKPILSYKEGKYSLQGTTQGRYLTGGVPPVRFSM